MSNRWMGVIGGVCAALLVVAAVLFWVEQDAAEREKPSSRDQESLARGGQTGSDLDRGDHASVAEDPEARRTVVIPAIEKSTDAPPTGTVKSASERGGASPALSDNHPLAVQLPGWLQPASVNETAIVKEAPTHSNVDFVGLGSSEFDILKAEFKRMETFDPADPDRVLELDLTALTFEGEADDALNYEVAVIRSRDQASWRVAKTRHRSVELFVPVAEGENFQVQLRTEDGRTALGYLPVPGNLHLGYPTRDLYRRGMVSFRLRLVAPDQQPRARSIQVTDASGNAIADAAVLQGGQEFGRSNVDGMIEWPFPPIYPAEPIMRTGRDSAGNPTTELIPDPNWPQRHQRGFMVSAPGYVPVFLPRAEVADPEQPTLRVQLNAREFVASVWGGVIDERFMYLAPNTFSLKHWHNNHSEILSLGWDLLPLEPDAQVAGWEDAFYYLTSSQWGREHWATIREGKWGRDRGPGTTGHLGPFGRGRRKPSAEPFTRNESAFTPSWADGLESAVGRVYHECWPDFYGGWYNGRWSYEAGQFDVVLPYPGKFLLLVGEEYREGMNGSKPGQVNHVLYINALDPADVKGELFRCPD